MERRNVSVASFWWFFNWCLFFTKVSKIFSFVCKHLVLPELFSSFYISPEFLGFCLNFDGFSYCLQFLIIIVIIIIIIIMIIIIIQWESKCESLNIINTLRYSNLYESSWGAREAQKKTEKGTNTCFYRLNYLACKRGMKLISFRNDLICVTLVMQLI